MLERHNRYFATLEIKELLPELHNKTKAYYKRLQETGVTDLWGDVVNCYYNMDNDGGHGSEVKLVSGYNSGEGVISIRANILRALLSSMLQAVTTQKPVWQPVAENTDVSSQSAVIATKNILDHNYRKYDVSSLLNKTVEYAGLMGTGYTVQLWNKPEKELKIFSTHPWRVVTPLQDNYQTPWYIVAERVNRFDIAAMYPNEKGDKHEMKDLRNNFPLIRTSNLGDIAQPFNMSTGGENSLDKDYIELFHFLHKRTPAVPDGRYVIYCNNRTYFEDVPLPYLHTSVHELHTRNIINSPHSYSPAYDLLSYAFAYDAILSKIIDNIDKGENWIFTDVLEPEIDIKNKVIKGAGSAQALSTLTLERVLFEALKYLKDDMQLMSGRNDTVLGASSAKSGSHAALLYQVANQFTQDFNNNFTTHIESLGSAQIDLVKQFQDDPVSLTISGEDNKAYVQEFKKEQVESIQSVVVKTVSPHLRTPAGQLQVAEDILSKSQPGDPEAMKRYAAVLEGRGFEDIFQEDRDLELTIKQEHEMLADYPNLTIVMSHFDEFNKPWPTGPIQVVPEVLALVSDDHIAHVKNHMLRRSSPSIRNDPNALKFLDIHIRHHFHLKQFGDGFYLQGTGQSRMPPGEPMSGEGGSIESQGSIQPNPEKPGAPVEPSGGMVSQMVGKNNPSQLPNMPNNPLSEDQNTNVGTVAQSDAIG